jgi:hypothetical protein
VERCPFLGRLSDEREEEAAEDLGAILLQQVFGGVYKDHLARIYLREQVELRLGIRTMIRKRFSAPTL